MTGAMNGAMNEATNAAMNAAAGAAGEGALAPFTPVNLLTGFLGSGKTTLLARLLADPALGDCAVLINEFGAVGLDHHLLERLDETTLLLGSGCVCCTIRGDLSQALRDLHSRRARGLIPPFRRVVIESTGLADPYPVLSTLKADPVLRHHFRAGNVITTVDAVNGAEQLARHAESVRQVAIADRLVVTKTDIARPDETAALLARLGTLNGAAPVFRAAEGGLDVARLVSEDATALGDRPASVAAWFRETFRSDDGSEAAVAADGAASHAGDRIRSFAVVLDEPMNWTAFGVWLTMLLNRHGSAVLRVKGILNVAGEDRPVAVHGVQHLVHPPVHMAGWPGGDRRSRIVFIVDGLDPDRIRRSLAAFHALGGAAPAMGALRTG